MQKPDLLSESYWSLHRNSLFFSSLSILSSGGIVKLTDALNGKIDASQKLTSFLAICAALYSYLVYMSEAARESSFKFEQGVSKLEKMNEGLSSRIFEMREYVNEIKDILREPSENTKYIVAQMGADAINAPIFAQNKPTYHTLMTKIRNELREMIIELSDIGSKLKRNTSDELELKRWVEFENRLSKSMEGHFASFHETFNDLVREQVAGPLNEFYEKLSIGMKKSNDDIETITTILQNMELDKNKIQNLSVKQKIFYSSIRLW